jgi:hypothetical protein
MADPPERLPPPPFWRSRYYALHVLGKPGRRNIDPADVLRALAAPYRRQRQPDGRIRHWLWVAERGHWLRVITEADGETVHNTFWDGGFEP